MYLAVTLLGVAVSGAALFWSERDATPEGEERRLPAPAEQATRAGQEAEQLERRQQALLRLVAARRQVAADVIAGRLTLLEAAARFRDLNAETPAFEDCNRIYPGNSPEERFCRLVIDQVESEMEEEPEQAAELRRRLEAELRQHLGSGGAIRLPD
jgi:hypothetical protein